MNMTGPGDHTIPRFGDRQLSEIANSNKKTAPCYSLAPKTKQPYFPQYELDFVGQDSPGMNHYMVKTTAISENRPIYSIKRAGRFEGIEERNRDQRTNIPNQYIKNHSQALFKKNGGYSISSGKCWTLKMDKEDETTPGPVYQTQYLRSIAKHVDGTDELKNGTFGALKDKQRTIPYNGLDVAYLGQDSPGPLIYNGADSAKIKT